MHLKHDGSQNAMLAAVAFIMIAKNAILRKKQAKIR